MPPPQRQYGSKKPPTGASVYKRSARSTIAEQPGNPPSSESSNLNGTTKSSKKGTNAPACNASTGRSKRQMTSEEKTAVLESLLQELTDGRKEFEKTQKNGNVVRKCWGCRVNGLKMPLEPVGEDETELLDCGCKKSGALIELIYVKLGLVGLEPYKEKGQGWKMRGRPERERLEEIMNRIGTGIDDLLELLQMEIEL